METIRQVFTPSLLHGQDVQIQPSTLPELFDKQFEDENFGSKLALMEGEMKMTFLDLQNESDAFATNLVQRFQSEIHGAKGVPKIFGLMTQPGKDRIVAILGLLKINCAYLPLDFVQPPDRMVTVLQDAGVKYMLCDKNANKEVLEKVVDSYPDLLFIYTTDSSKRDDEISLTTAVIEKDENPLVCVLYTSGSSDKPKGVPCYTLNLVNRLTWQWEVVPFSVDAIGCQKTSILFVDFLTEVFGCLLKGIPLVILPRSVITQPQAFIKAISDFKISHLVLVPSHLQMLIEYLQSTKNQDMVSPMKLISSGEYLQLRTGLDFFSVFPLGSVLYNLYGSTETTGDVMFDKWEGVEDIENSSIDGVLSLGTPVYNTSVVLLDENKEPCEEGTVGQVYVTGHNIIHSYLNNKDVNTESFIHNKVFSKEGHGTLFKMGDLGVVKGGRLYHKGRSDMQVKIRGHRVNLCEIQEIVEHIDVVDSCIVLPYYDTKGYIVPVVFYTSKSEEVHTAEQIKSECDQKLPKYALPRMFKVNHFPLQEITGKVDRQKLLSLYQKKVLNLATGLPLTKSERILNVLSRNLSLPPEDIRQDASFFENGGNSLTAVAAISDLCSNGIDLTLADFLGFKTISELFIFNGLSNPTCPLSLGYQPVMLNSIANKDRAIDILARGFSQKDTMSVTLGTTPDTIVKMITSFWREILRDDLSVVVIDTNSMDVVAACLALDLKTEITPEWHKLEVCTILEAVEEPERGKLMKSNGRWAETFMAAVEPEFPDSLILCILEAMSDFSLQVIQTRGYDGIFEVNTHPVIQTMAEERYGFITMNTVHVRSFCYLGRYPFKEVEDTHIIKCMVKHFT